MGENLSFDVARVAYGDTGAILKSMWSMNATAEDFYEVFLDSDEDIYTIAKAKSRSGTADRLSEIIDHPEHGELTFGGGAGSKENLAAKRKWLQQFAPIDESGYHADEHLGMQVKPTMMRRFQEWRKRKQAAGDEKRATRARAKASKEAEMETAQQLADLRTEARNMLVNDIGQHKNVTPDHMRHVIRHLKNTFGRLEGGHAAKPPTTAFGESGKPTTGEPVELKETDETKAPVATTSDDTPREGGGPSPREIVENIDEKDVEDKKQEYMAEGVSEEEAEMKAFAYVYAHVEGAMSILQHHHATHAHTEQEDHPPFWSIKRPAEVSWKEGDARKKKGGQNLYNLLTEGQSLPWLEQEEYKNMPAKDKRSELFQPRGAEKRTSSLRGPHRPNNPHSARLLIGQMIGNAIANGQKVFDVVDDGKGGKSISLEDGFEQALSSAIEHWKTDPLNARSHYEIPESATDVSSPILGSFGKWGSPETWYSQILPGWLDHQKKHAWEDSPLSQAGLEPGDEDALREAMTARLKHFKALKNAEAEERKAEAEAAEAEKTKEGMATTRENLGMHETPSTEEKTEAKEPVTVDTDAVQQIAAAQSMAGAPCSRAAEGGCAGNMKQDPDTGEPLCAIHWYESEKEKARTESENAVMGAGSVDELYGGDDNIQASADTIELDPFSLAWGRLLRGRD